MTSPAPSPTPSPSQPPYAAAYRPPLDRPAPRGPRTGLVLCGGGITGAMYEVGCLAALEDAFEDFYACDFDAFVGSASGATVAMALAGGLRASRLYRALIDPADDFFPFGRPHILQGDAGEWRRVWRTVVAATKRAARSVVSKPLEIDVFQELERFLDSLPAGLLSLDAYQAFLGDFMHRRDIPTDFAALPRPLAIAAHDLDAGARTIFGRGAMASVPVPEAIAAASAIPILFSPVRIQGRDYIDGGLGDNAHADVAAEMGCQRALIVNPMVPIRAHAFARDVPTGHGMQRHVRDKGMLWVYHQAWRIRAAERLASGMAHFRESFPDTELLRLEPAADDAIMFMHSPMNFAARRHILTHAYRSTRLSVDRAGHPLRGWIEERGFGYRGLGEG